MIRNLLKQIHEIEYIIRIGQYTLIVEYKIEQNRIEQNRIEQNRTEDRVKHKHLDTFSIIM